MKQIQNKDKFIRNTPHGKLMENTYKKLTCVKCKYAAIPNCHDLTNSICFEAPFYYFKKEDKTNEQ